MSANPANRRARWRKSLPAADLRTLALTCTQVDQTPTLIFDEIDQGIGGRVGGIVGEKLWSLSSRHQVMVVTHLPQLAGYADRHFHATKVTDARRTITQVVPLNDEPQRVEELAAMLGAHGESGRQSARELLVEAQQYKEAHPSGQKKLL
jgi:DNA repair protein RecN (Recombination protein N)